MVRIVVSKSKSALAQRAEKMFLGGVWCPLNHSRADKIFSYLFIYHVKNTLSVNLLRLYATDPCAVKDEGVNLVLNFLSCVVLVAWVERSEMGIRFSRSRPVK
ncbi:hypothetical protein ABZP36_029632 [Zizania latifolia]